MDTSYIPRKSRSSIEKKTEQPSQTEVGSTSRSKAADQYQSRGDWQSTLADEVSGSDAEKQLEELLNALRFQLARKHITGKGAESTSRKIKQQMENLLNENDQLTEEQYLLCQKWAQFHDNKTGKAWQAIENLGWKIETTENPYRLTLTCDQEQSLPTVEVKAFLRERIEVNLRQKIQEGLKEHIASAPLEDKGWLRKTLAVISDPANQGCSAYECGNVTVRFYQLAKEVIKLYCLQDQTNNELYVMSSAISGERLFAVIPSLVTYSILSTGRVCQDKRGHFLTKGCQDNNSLKKAKTIHSGVAYNFPSGKLVTTLIDMNKNCIYITDNMISLSRSHFSHARHLSHVKAEDGWTRYQITDFNV